MKRRVSLHGLNGVDEKHRAAVLALRRAVDELLTRYDLPAVRMVLVDELKPAGQCVDNRPKGGIDFVRITAAIGDEPWTLRVKAIRVKLGRVREFAVRAVSGYGVDYLYETERRTTPNQMTLEPLVRFVRRVMGDVR